MKHRTDLPGGRWISAEVTGDGPGVLLLHGIPGAGAVWNGVRDRLAARHRVIVPTRVLWGDCDPFFPVTQAERTAALVEGAAVVRLPGAGHFLPEERPVELAEAIAALWRTIGDRTDNAEPLQVPISHLGRTL